MSASPSSYAELLGVLLGPGRRLPALRLSWSAWSVARLQVGGPGPGGKHAIKKEEEGSRKGGETSSGPGVPASAFIALPCKYTM